MRCAIRVLTWFYVAFVAYFVLHFNCVDRCVLFVSGSSEACSPLHVHPAHVLGGALGHQIHLRNVHFVPPYGKQWFLKVVHRLLFACLLAATVGAFSHLLSYSIVPKSYLCCSLLKDTSPFDASCFATFLPDEKASIYLKLKDVFRIRSPMLTVLLSGMCLLRPAVGCDDRHQETAGEDLHAGRAARAG